MCEQRDIVLLPVPFSDLLAQKRRPVVIISNNFYNSTHEDILVAAITSNLRGAFEGIIIESNDLELGTLPKTSQIRPDKIYSLSRKIIIKNFGKLKSSAFQEIIKTIKGILTSQEATNL